MRNCHFTLHDQVMKTCCVYCGVSLCCRNQANLRRCSTQTLRTLFSLKPSMLSRTWRSKNYLRMLSHSVVEVKFPLSLYCTYVHSYFPLLLSLHSCCACFVILCLLPPSLLSLFTLLRNLPTSLLHLCYLTIFSIPSTPLSFPSSLLPSPPSLPSLLFSSPPPPSPFSLLPIPLPVLSSQ